MVEWLYSFNFDHRFSCRDFHFQANYLLLTSLLFFTTISNAILMIIRFNFTYVFIFVLTIALKETHSFALGRFLYFLFAKWWMFTFQRHTHNLWMRKIRRFGFFLLYSAINRFKLYETCDLRWFLLKVAKHYTKMLSGHTFHLII